MNNILPFLLACAALASGSAWSQAVEAPSSAVSGNVAAVSDYRYRGLSQTRLRPAVQGGLDFVHPSGLYLGAWASSIRWIADAGGDARAEVDVYGGYRFAAGPVGLDVGALRYLYPRSALGLNPDTTELYAAATLGPATLKYSHATTNLFGFAASRGSHYLELGATFDTGYAGVSVVPHVGYQKVRNNPGASYTDWSLALAKDFGNGITASLAYVDTDANGYVAPDGRDLGRGAAVLGLKYTRAF